MYSRIRQAFRDSALFHWYKKIAAPGEYLWWRLRGSPPSRTPHWLKQRIIRQYGREFRLPVLIETGTNFGHMLYVQKRHFRELYSIELDPWRAASARQKFAGQPRIHILRGDSGEVLPKLLETIREPCLFWLDGHDWDTSTPVKREVDALFKHPVQGHVVLIDDAKWFDGRSNYPTIEELRERVAREYPGYVLEVKDEVIRIYQLTPRSSPGAG